MDISVENLMQRGVSPVRKYENISGNQWTVIPGHRGKHGRIPTLYIDLVDWWASKEVAGLLSSDIRTMILLVLWSLCDGTAPQLLPQLDFTLDKDFTILHGNLRSLLACSDFS